MFTKQKLPEGTIFQIQIFPLFQDLADCYFFSFRKIQRHFDLSIFPFSPTGLVLSPHRISLPDLGVRGTVGRGEQNRQSFSLTYVTSPPACIFSSTASVSNITHLSQCI